MTLTIDTQVLCCADDPGHPDCPIVLRLIGAVEKSACIAVDHDHRILGQYWDNLSGSGHAQKWLARMLSPNRPGGCRVQYKDGTVPCKHRPKLSKELGFKDDDLPFVGVAYRTNSKLLVAHESDYTDEVCEYLRKSNLAVRVECAADAEAEITGPL